jgi:hypothetical protein
LIAAGDKQSFGVLYGACDEGVAGGGAVGNDECGDRIFSRAELLDVWVVGVGASGTNHKKIPAATALAHPLKGGVHVGAAAH